MADKGFDLKVLIPTDNGTEISENGIEDASYYLMYNVSNRSYQFSGKIKTSELFSNHKFDTAIFISELKRNNIDKLVCSEQNELNKTIEVSVVTEKDIGIVLNNFIDIIDKKRLSKKS
ncbi:MAG: hypothetical protein KOO66_03210 [Bacteroidales bacterium]|nr:hypothetical protein [Bacteroidales bacterium]